MNAKALILWLFIPTMTLSQGFADLGADAEGFSTPQPNHALEFPTDAGPHPNYRIEWWYLTANLTGPDGVPYGLQWTLFRSALSPNTGDGWEAEQIWMGHAAVTTPEAHYATERFARGGIGQAGVVADPFNAWIDDWEMKTGPNGMELTASGPEFAYEMSLTNTQTRVPHGDGGYSVKSAAGRASHYYSLPFLQITGTLTLPAGKVAVTGQAWLDREWSSQPLAADQTGWDWFSLSFDGGAKLMGFVLRQSDGNNYTSATWITPDAQPTAYPDGAFAADPLESHAVAGRNVPVEWQVRLPDQGVDVRVTALNPDAWMSTMVPYWEGPVQVTGSHTGRGYLEMTGYE